MEKIATRDPTMYVNGGASRTNKTVKYWNTRLKIPDEDTVVSKDILMSRSLDLYKNNSIAAAIIKKIVANVVGPGLKVKSTIDDRLLGITTEEKERLEKAIETLWEMWSNSTQCDYRRLSNFAELQGQYVRSWLIFGEGLAMLPYNIRRGDIVSLKVDLIENHRLESPLGSSTYTGIVNGVEFDNYGRLKSYHFSTTYLNNLKKYHEVPAYDRHGRKNVLCLFTKERTGQRVGFPLLSPVITDLKRLSQWQKAETEAAITSALHPLVVERDLEVNSNVSGREDEEGIVREIITENGEKKEIITKTVEGGSVLDLAPGEKMKAITSGRDPISYETFLMTTCKTIGAAVELPYEVLLTAFNNNYSASRAAILEAWKMYLEKRARLRENFCEPIYEHFIDEIVARGYIDIPGYFDNPIIKKAVLRAEWYGPIQGSIDPKKEAEADAINLANGTKSRARISRENGMDWDQTISQLANEEKEMEKLGMIRKEVAIGADKDE